MDLKEALTHPSPKVTRLLELAARWQGQPVPQAVSEPRTVQPRSQPPLPLSVRLGDDGISRMIADFKSGMTREKLAEHYGCSLSSVKRILRTNSIRRR